MPITNISVVRSSLLDIEADVIVNAANSLMRGGGGIDGLIHQRAGRKMLWELQRVAPQGCEVGEVVVTSGFDLPFSWVIHTPGPLWRGGSQGEPLLLARCYRHSMEKAHELGARSIGFCSISTGVYGYPLELAAPIAIQTIAESAHLVDQVILAMYGEREYAIFSHALDQILEDQLD